MSFKKFFAIFSSVLLVMMPAQAKTLEFTVNSNSLYVSDNGIVKSEIDAPAYIESGRTMVPLRVISENFGAEVLWDGDTQTVTIKNGDAEIKLTINIQTAVVNGEEYALDVAPVIINGRTMVPLRFISEALGRDVEYVAATSQILISDEEPVAVINGKNITVDDYKFLRMYLGYDIPDEYLSELIHSINAYIEELVLISDVAQKSGVSLSNEELALSVEEIVSLKDVLYQDALLANGAKILTDYGYASKYINTLEFDVTVDEVEKEYKDNYVRAKHILIFTADKQTGKPYSAEEKAKAREKAQYVLSKLKNGEDFDKLIKEFGEDPGVGENPNGYVFTKNEMIPEFENAVYELGIGETTGIVESEFGYHIIKRLALPELDDYTSYTLFQKMNQDQYIDFYEKLKGDSDIKYNKTVEEIAQMLKK